MGTEQMKGWGRQMVVALEVELATELGQGRLLVQELVSGSVLVTATGLGLAKSSVAVSEQTWDGGLATELEQGRPWDGGLAPVLVLAKAKKLGLAKSLAKKQAQVLKKKTEGKYTRTEFYM
jgi:hypothetical protein